MTINHNAKGQSQVNLSDLLLSTAPGAVGTTPVAAAKGENPQELALFEGFAQVFAVTAPTAQEVVADDAQTASGLPGGKALPDETGNILPDIAAPALVAPALPAPVLSETADTAGPVPQASLPGASAALHHETPGALVQVPAAGPPAAASAQAQQFERHDSALRASQQQASYVRVPVASEPVEQPIPAPITDKPAAVRTHAAPLEQPQGAEVHPSRPETSRAAPLPQPSTAPTQAARAGIALPEASKPATAGPAALPAKGQAPADPAPVDPVPADPATADAAKPQRKLHIDLPLRPIAAPAFTSRAATPLAQAEVPARPVAEAQPTPAAAASEQATRPVPIAQLLRPATRTAPAATQQVPIETAETAPESQLQRPVPAPSTAAATQQPATPTLVAPEAVRVPAQPAMAEPTPAPAPAPLRHDFGQVVERLAEAREMARPGRAEMQVTHREFGPVSMQFDVTGGALKVALANAHAGFAPAVQAALAERPVAAPAEAVRVDVPGQQQGQAAGQSASSQSTAASSAGQASPGQPNLGQSQAESQQQRHNDAPRNAAVAGQSREAGEARDDENTRHSNPRRDTALFA